MPDRVPVPFARRRILEPVKVNPVFFGKGTHAFRKNDDRKAQFLSQATQAVIRIIQIRYSESLAVLLPLRHIRRHLHPGSDHGHREPAAVLSNFEIHLLNQPLCEFPGMPPIIIGWRFETLIVKPESISQRNTAVVLIFLRTTRREFTFPN
jgi:hypothetical protein